MNLLTIAAATAALAVSPDTKALTVPNASMAPTLSPGATILANYDAYDATGPQLLDTAAPRTITVPKGRYFLLGDKRGWSDDSRFWGPVPTSALVGRVDECNPQPAAGCPPR